MPPTPFCSPHADKVPFCYVRKQYKTADNAEQSGEKETLDIGLTLHGIGSCIGQECRITILQCPSPPYGQTHQQVLPSGIAVPMQTLRLPYVPQQFSGEFLFVGRTH